MREEKKREKLAALLGIDLKQVAPPTGESKEDISRDADAVFYFIHKPQAFTQKECRQCGLVFATNQRTVGLCSDRCRIKWLHSIGIQWDHTKPQTERWGHTLPLVVLPEVLVLLKSAVATLDHDVHH